MFKEVEKNAQNQDRAFREVRSEFIEDYYPELHREEKPPVSCTLGGLLIPDLMTRRSILIDLDDLRTEEHLIQRYGVDKAFLMQLQARGLVHIATNLEPGRHEGNEWMHDILANRETIFKSTRTPRFFSARFPDIETTQVRYRDYLQKRLEGLSPSDYNFLIGRMDVPPTHAPRAGAANKLAWDLARVQAMHGCSLGEDDLPTLDDLVGKPTHAMDTLYKYKFFEVSPHSGALGCEMLVPFQQIKRLMPESPPSDILRMDSVAHEGLQAFLTTVTFNLMPADLQGSAYWHGLMPRMRESLLDKLQENIQDRSTAAVEQDLRLRIARSDSNLSLEELRELVEKDIQMVSKYGDVVSRGYSSINTMFAGYVSKTLSSLGVPNEYAWVIGAGVWGYVELKKKDAKKILEFAIPRIRVANYVRSRTV